MGSDEKFRPQDNKLYVKIVKSLDFFCGKAFLVENVVILLPTSAMSTGRKKYQGL